MTSKKEKTKSTVPLKVSEESFQGGANKSCKIWLRSQARCNVRWPWQNNFTSMVETTISWIDWDKTKNWKWKNEDEKYGQPSQGVLLRGMQKDANKISPCWGDEKQDSWAFQQEGNLVHKRKGLPLMGTDTELTSSYGQEGRVYGYRCRNRDRVRVMQRKQG